jgi:hypothetical protein
VATRPRIKRTAIRAMASQEPLTKDFNRRPLIAPILPHFGNEPATNTRVRILPSKAWPIAQFHNQVREAASVSGLFHRKELRQPTVRCRRWHFSDMALAGASPEFACAAQHRTVVCLTPATALEDPSVVRANGAASARKPRRSHWAKAQTAIRRPGRNRNADSRAPWRRAHIRSSRPPAGPRRRLAS